MASFTANKSIKNDFDTKWIAAYFLGVETASGSFLVANKEGTFKIANIRRGPNESAFEKAILDEVTLSHSDYVSNGAATSMRTPQVVHAPIRAPDASRNVPVPRRMMLRQSDFNEHGLTIGCPGCQYVTHEVGHTRNHTEECRRRIEEAIAKSEEGIARTQKQRDRIDFAVAQVVADGDHDAGGRDGNKEGHANDNA